MRAVTVRAPATSANLGPGFDTLGLALGLWDELTVEASFSGRVPSSATVSILGEGTDNLPVDEDHLVVRTMRRVFEQLQVPQPDLTLTCSNRIPHGRGLGSSAAAIVGGVVAARALAPDSPGTLSDASALALAAELEGHPDNVAACLLGGLTLAWSESDLTRPTPPTRTARAVRLEPAPLDTVVFVPDTALSTVAARELLPAEVPHADAAANAARAGLLVACLTGATNTDQLMVATEDRLHQHQRAPAMPESYALVQELRGQGAPAVISGAGPTVLAFGDAQRVRELAALDPAGFQAYALKIDRAGARVVDQIGNNPADGAVVRG